MTNGLEGRGTRTSVGSSPWSFDPLESGSSKPSIEGAVDAFATLLAQRIAEALEPLILGMRMSQPEKMQQLPPTMSAAETAEFLGIGRDAVYGAVHSGELPSLKINSRVRIPTHALLKKLESLA